MKLLPTAAAVGIALFSTSVFAAADDYVMSCDEVITKLNREVTDEARARFVNLAGSCLGVVERNEALYMHTKVVVRRVSRRAVTLYLPATDRTFEVTPDASARVMINGRKTRTRDLVRGQELQIYILVDKFTQPIIDEIAFETETNEFVSAPAVIAPALPTTG